MANNYNCIIVDDELGAIELLKSRIQKLYKNISVTASYSRWEDALAALREASCDLLFMDISMPGKTAIELLKMLPGLQSEIIFVTAYEQYALDAFAFSTSGYILKPIDDTDLSAAIDKAVGRIQNKKTADLAHSPASLMNEIIGIPDTHGISYVNLNNILYLQSINKCTKIVTTRHEYVSAFNLGRYKEQVSRPPFFQVHRAYIINLNHIHRYESSGLVIMSNKAEIPMSRNVKNDFLKLLNSGH